MKLKDIVAEQQSTPAELADEIVKLGPEIARIVIALLKPKS